MKTIKEIISASCDNCGGVGFVFWNNTDDFDVETCICVEDGSLFWNGEND